MLTETQLLLLNNLIYIHQIKGASSASYNSLDERITVKDILGNIDTKKLVGNVTMTEKEWQEVINAALSDEQICNLEVQYQNYENDTGAGMAVFVDASDNNQPYAVFAGTGANEWADDCVAGTQIESIQQGKALEWINSLPYDNIIVSGHSKGGNKAMYVAITSDKVKECFAFDGEGFSPEFCYEYAEKIAQVKDNIHLIASYRDFVNILLKDIAGDIKYIVNDIGVSNPGEYHAPNALFKYASDGSLIYAMGDIGEQDPLMEMLHNYTVYIIDNATDAEKQLALVVLGELLTSFLGGKEGIYREDIIDRYGVEAAEIILRYLQKYLRDLALSNPLLYEKYKYALDSMVLDSINNFWVYLIDFCCHGKLDLIGGFPGYLLDKITDGTVWIIFRHIEIFNGGNISCRDFSLIAEEKMMKVAKEVEDEQWWQVTRWDCWYRVEKLFGHLNLDHYTANVDAYYRKLIDINDATVKDIRRIFDNVRELDASYSNSISEYTLQINDSYEKLKRFIV